jgi:hypothetical protein
MVSSETYIPSATGNDMQYIRYDPWVQPHPPEREIAEYLKKKLLRALPLNYIYSCSLCQGVSDGVQVMTRRGGPVPP